MPNQPVLLAIMLTVLLPIVNGMALADSNQIEGLLPMPGFSREWAINGKINRYTADNLYVYINGEAELYLPYGFDILESAFYSKEDDSKSGVVTDVYRMGSLIDAFGIYSNYRDNGAELVKIGTEGFTSESQLMFYKDRYFIRLSISGTVADERNLLMGFAKKIAEKIPGSPSPPAELSMLNIPGIVPDTLKYLAQSVLGYVFFQKGLTAEIVIDGEPAKVFIVPGKSLEASSTALQQYINYLKESGVSPERRGKENEETFVVLDPLYKGTVIRRKGTYLFGVIKVKDPQRAMSVIDQIQSRLSRP